MYNFSMICFKHIVCKTMVINRYIKNNDDVYYYTVNKNKYNSIFINFYKKNKAFLKKTLFFILLSLC